MNEITQTHNDGLEAIVLKGNKQTLATQDKPQQLTKRRTKKRSSSLGLDSEKINVTTTAKKVSPTEVATKRVKKEVAEIGQAYVQEWQKQLPKLTGFMDDVSTEVGDMLTDVWGLNDNVQADGVSYVVEDEAA